MHTKILTAKIDIGISQIIEDKLNTYFASLNGDNPTVGLYDCILHEVEHPLISITLKKCGGNKVKTAKILGINRNTLTKKIIDYNITL